MGDVGRVMKVCCRLGDVGRVVKVRCEEVAWEM